MLSKSFLSLAASLSTASAAVQGFNYGATNVDGTYRVQNDFEIAFREAKALVGTEEAFTSARLYTMTQGASADTPTEAIKAAINTNTTLLLGLWASGDPITMTNQIAALTSAIQLYDGLASLTVGISVGSEDLYRNSITGIENKSGVGANPADLVDFINRVRAAVKGTGLGNVPIGHVDTWDAWSNTSNSAVAKACDFLGMDTYPYFQYNEPNDITQAKDLFYTALGKTQAAGMGKPVWITETGHPVSGAQSGASIASTTNAQTYWDEVGCPNFGNVNIWWYTLFDRPATTSFGIVGSSTSTTPLFDLSCSNSTNSSSSAKPSGTSGAAASSGFSLSPSGKGQGISPSGSGYAAPSGTGSAGFGSGSNGSYTASTIRTAPAGAATSSSGTGSGSGSGSGSSGSSGSGASSSGTPAQSSNSGSSLTGSMALALGAVFAVAAAL